MDEILLMSFPNHASPGRLSKAHLYHTMRLHRDLDTLGLTCRPMLVKFMHEITDPFALRFNLLLRPFVR